jgi:hypothetical protein
MLLHLIPSRQEVVSGDGISRSRAPWSTCVFVQLLFSEQTSYKARYAAGGSAMVDLRGLRQAALRAKRGLPLLHVTGV